MVDLGGRSGPAEILQVVGGRIGRPLRLISVRPEAGPAPGRPGPMCLPVYFGELHLGWLDAGQEPLSPREGALLGAVCRLLAAALWEQETSGRQWGHLLDGGEIEATRLAAMFRRKGWPAGAGALVLACHAPEPAGDRAQPPDQWPGVERWVERSLPSPTIPGSGGLLFSKGDRHAALLPAPPGPQSAGETPAGVAVRLRRQVWRSAAQTVSVGVGGVAVTPAEVSGAWAKALDLLRWGRTVLGPGAVADSEALGVFGVLQDHAPPEALAGYARRRLGPLEAHDRTTGSELYKTLRVFLEHEGNAVAASEQLFIHYNTMRHRLRRLEALLDVDLGRLPDRLELWVSLQIDRLFPRPETGPAE